MKYCEVLRGLIKDDRIMVNDKKWTVPELFTFGLNNRGTYSSQSGHDDVAMTLVNLPGLFEGYDFNQMVGEVFDELEDNSYKDLIIKKLEDGQILDENTRGPSTKDGRMFGDFNSMM
jgi:hypothetical protein